MIVNVIHLSSEQVIPLGEKAIAAEVLRRQSYLEEMATQRVKFLVWDGVIDKPAFKGVSKAHKRIVRYAKDNKMPMVVIMEDDCKFSHEDSFKYFIINIPNDFDLYFGSIYDGEIGEDNKLLNGASGILTLFIIHERFYDTFLNINSDTHLDNSLGEIAFNHRFIVCKPEICTQMNGYSFNHKKKMEYDKFLDGKELFNGL